MAGPESKKQSSCEARMEKVVASILAMFSVCKLLIVVLMSPYDSFSLKVITVLGILCRGPVFTLQGGSRRR